MEKKIEIVRLDHNGRGIGYLEGKITFVPNTLPGEIVEIETIKEKKNLIEAKVKKYVLCSKDRIDVECPYYSYCGGCNLMHLEYKNQLKYKKEKGIDILKRFGGVDIKQDVNILESPHFYYRNKVVFHVKNGKIGLYEEDSHYLVEIEKCMLLHPKINELLTKLKTVNFLNSVEKIMIRVFQNVKDSQIVFYPQENIPKEEIIHSLKNSVTSIYVDNQCIYGNSEICEKIGDRIYSVLPKSFFQVNSIAVQTLYDEVKNYLDPQPTDKVLDLYCGAGTIGLYIAPYVKFVYGIEIVKEAIDSANKNKELNRISNIQFFVGDTKEVLKKENLMVNKIIVDPPRSGLDSKTKEYLKTLKPEKIVYVSCNPITLARDIKELKHTYQFSKITFVDMFPNTDHVESVCLLVLKTKNMNGCE